MHIVLFGFHILLACVADVIYPWVTVIYLPGNFRLQRRLIYLGNSSEMSSASCLEHCPTILLDVSESP